MAFDVCQERLDLSADSEEGWQAGGSGGIGRHYALWQIVFKSGYIPCGTGILPPGDECRAVSDARWYTLFFSVKVDAGNHAGA